MTATIEDDKTITMDRQGRVVLPKAIRDEAGIVPGTPLAIVVRDGRIEISPVYPEVRLVERDGWTVAERVTPGPVLTSDLVRKTLSDLRCLTVGSSHGAKIRSVAGPGPALREGRVK